MKIFFHNWKQQKFNLSKRILVQIFVKCNILLHCMSLPVLESWEVQSSILQKLNTLGGGEGGSVKFCPRRTHRKSVCPSGVEKFTGLTLLPCNGSYICKSLNTWEWWAYLKCVKLKAWNDHIIFWWQVWWWPRALYHETPGSKGPTRNDFSF